MVIDGIASIPRGRITSYGAIAEMAGNARGARQVARILSSCSEAEDLPWWRVVNKAGAISLPVGECFDRQKARLAAEDVEVDDQGRVDLKHHLWEPDWSE